MVDDGKTQCKIRNETGRQDAMWSYKVMSCNGRASYADVVLILCGKPRFTYKALTCVVLEQFVQK